MKKVVANKIKTFFSDYPLSHYDKGQILMRAGETVTGIYYLQEGQVKQYDISDKGEEVIVNDFSAGMFFPEPTVLNHSPNQYFYEASEAVELNFAPIENVAKLIKNNPDITYELLAELSLETSSMQRRMAHLMGGNSYSRTLYELLTESRKFGKRQKNGSYELSMNEEDLAHRAGLTRETVNRELRKLKNSGLITIEHRIITIKNLRKLESELDDRL